MSYDIQPEDFEGGPLDRDGYPLIKLKPMSPEVAHRLAQNSRITQNPTGHLGMQFTKGGIIIPDPGRASHGLRPTAFLSGFGHTVEFHSLIGRDHGVVHPDVLALTSVVHDEGGRLHRVGVESHHKDGQITHKEWDIGSGSVDQVNNPGVGYLHYSFDSSKPRHPDFADFTITADNVRKHVGEFEGVGRTEIGHGVRPSRPEHALETLRRVRERSDFARQNQSGRPEDEDWDEDLMFSDPMNTVLLMRSVRRQDTARSVTSLAQFHIPTGKVRPMHDFLGQTHVANTYGIVGHHQGTMSPEDIEEIKDNKGGTRRAYDYGEDD